MMTGARTQVAIVGAGPAGLMLGHLLDRLGIDSVVLENRSRDYVIERVRAGVLEQGTVDLLHEVGLGDRLAREGMRHEGIHLAFEGRRHRIDMTGLTGRAITVYGQSEVVKDLLAARDRSGRPLHFDVVDLAVDDLLTTTPVVRYRLDGQMHELRADVIAGCDGFHGVCRPSIPASALTVHERVYPFGWLGILAHAAPSSHELVYSLHERGFALFSMRSESVTRLYLQCDPDEDLSQWPDERIWAELDARLATDDGWHPNRGEIFQKGVTGMRSFMVDTMRYGRLFLAGDAAHIVPPTGAKGLNLAIGDVQRLARALAAFLGSGDTGLIDLYSETSVRRAWRAQRFSYWMTTMLHLTEPRSAFDYRRQIAELDYVVNSSAAMTSLAENYVG